MEEYLTICFYGNSHIRERIITASNEETAIQEMKKFVLEQGIKENSIISLSATLMSVYETKGESNES